MLRLTGMSNVIFATKRNLNTRSLLLNRFGFAQFNNRADAIDQKCGQPNCKRCTLTFDHSDMVQPVILVRAILYPTQTQTCKFKDAIYMFKQCHLCNQVDFGRSINRVNIRRSDHRVCFKPNKYKASTMATNILKIILRKFMNA